MRKLHFWVAACVTIGAFATVTMAASPPPLTAAQKAILAKYKISAKDEATLLGASANAGANAKPTAVAGSANKKTASDADLDTEDCVAGWQFLIRSDFKDIGLLCGSTATSQATGAKLAFESDSIAGNTQTTLIGTAAVAYTNFQTITASTAPQLYYDTFGAYFSPNFTYNSTASLAKKNVDTFQIGGAAELGYAALGGFHDFRLTAGDAHDVVAGTDVGTLALEWFPVYYQQNIHYGVPLPFLPEVLSTFSPEVALRYDSAFGPQETVGFSGGQRSLRIGPEINWTLAGRKGTVFDKTTLRFVSDLDYETYSARWLPWFEANLTYNLDDKGMVGLTGTFDDGTDPQTGAATNKLTIGLTGKL